MSYNWIIVIPAAADYLPSEEAQRKAVTLFEELAPAADEIKAEATAGVRFIDCGANFERLFCPDCDLRCGFQKHQPNNSTYENKR